MKSHPAADTNGLPSPLARAPAARAKTAASRRRSPRPPAAQQGLSVSIVIPHLSAPQLDACLSSIQMHGAQRSFEVIVVFDGSPEPEMHKIETRYRNIRTERLPETSGFARACNAGAQLSSAKYLVFLNDDTVVTAGWLDRLVDFIESDPRIGIAGPKLLYPDSEQIQHCGTVFNEQRLGEHIYRHRPSSLAAANRPRNYRSITGACIIIERADFQRLGGFDIRFHRGGGCEDTDLCFKMLEQGRTVTYCPSSTVYHHEGASRGLRTEFHPEEVYNQQLLRRQWEKFLTPDSAEYELLAEIEAIESMGWRWLRDVPADVVIRHCKKLHADGKRLDEQLGAMAAERDRLLGEQADAAARLDAMAAERDAVAAQRNAVAAERDRVSQDRAAGAARLEATEREREVLVAERDRLQQENAATAARFDALGQERDALVAEREQAAEAIIAATERMEAVVSEREALRTELDAARHVHEVLAAERDRALEAEAAVVDRLAAAAKVRGALAVECDRLTTENDRLLAELDGLVRRQDAWDAERDRLLHERAAIEAELDRVLNDRDAVQSLRDRETRERDDLALLNLQLRRQSDALVREFDAARRECTRLAQERDAVAADLVHEIQRRSIMEREFDAARTANERHSRERDDLKLRCFQLHRERDAVAGQFAELTHRHDWASGERNKIARERDALALLCDELTRLAQPSGTLDRKRRRLAARVQRGLRSLVPVRWRARARAAA